MSAQPQSPAPEPPSCSCAVVRDGLEPARCRCHVEPVLPKSFDPALNANLGPYARSVTRGTNIAGGFTFELVSGAPVLSLANSTGATAFDVGEVERARDAVLAAPAEPTFGLPEGIQITGHRGTLQQTQALNPRPSLGRVVHVLVHPSLNGGLDVASAVITRVCSRNDDGSWRVNLRVWLDGTNYSHEWAPGRTLHADEDTARRHATAHLDQLDHAVLGVYGHCFWPARA